MISALASAAKHWLSHIYNFSSLVLDKPLRNYQREPAEAILQSILHGKGLSFAVMMSRQAGKNEASAQLEAYLLNLYQRRGGQIVKASPTFKPQTINSILRLADRLDNPWNRDAWRRREGYIIELGKARTLFFSADPSSSVVGGTADLLLECDEAQDVQPTKWDKDFSPMGASTNVTTVFWGTAWTKTTMLATTIQHLQRLQTKDGIRRVFTYHADQVALEVPSYGRYVKTQVAKLGRNHPLIKTQYYLETIDGEGGLFNRMRRALMRGTHERQPDAPRRSRKYALLIDVAGEDEQAGDALDRALLGNRKRDATALTVVDISVSYGQMPCYTTVDRKIWIGTKHTSLYSRILALDQLWHPIYIIVDATGVGAGLAAFLAKALGEKVIPVLFSSRTKSDLGWDFLAIVETGRYQDYADDQQPDTLQFWHEVEACQHTIREGPNQTMSWGVWETPAYDGLIAYGHDDTLISAALTAILDKQEWPGTGESATVERPDDLATIDKAQW